MLLLVDDLFLVHEALGKGQQALFGVYALAALFFAYRFRRLLVALGPTILLFAGACFALSMVEDEWGSAGRYHYEVEDGAKFVGLAAWTAFWIRAVWFRGEIARVCAAAEPERSGSSSTPPS